ncbi:MAG: PD40 domain-containing protein, partial [Algicola sp.]|nr:PD40 domain-containing protein [Algicola sp.]
QLRKAFGDDAKKQAVITTISRVGYSLVAEVDWQAAVPDLQKNHYRKYGLLVGVVLLAIAVFWQPSEAPNPLPINRLTPITTTDHEEFSASFSPDGRHVSFGRKGELWIKELKTSKTHKLADVGALYGKASWSPDGKQLTFAADNGNKQCSEISTIAFSMTTNPPPRLLLPCVNQAHQQVHWLNQNTLVFISENQVNTLDLISNKVTPLYAPTDAKPYYLSFNPHINTLAIMQRDLLRKTTMVLLNPSTGKFDKVALNVPQGISNYHKWRISWHPNNKTLISSVDHALLAISLNGDVFKHPVTTTQKIIAPVFHPDGTRIAATMGTLDLDVAQIDFAQQANEHIINRSTVEDYYAQYQPDGDKVAFISGRGGSHQIWLAGPQPIQLSQLPGSISPRAFVWSEDGQSMVFLANKSLYWLNLDGQTQPLDTPFDVAEIYQSVTQNQLLLSVFSQQQRKIVLFNTKTAEQKVLHIGYALWAQRSTSSELFIIDDNHQLLQINNGKSQPLQAFVDLKVYGQFFVKDGLLIAHAKGDLWSYDLVNKKRVELIEGIDGISYLTDIDLNNQRLLHSRLISTKRNLVMFNR